MKVYFVIPFIMLLMSVLNVASASVSSDVDAIRSEWESISVAAKSTKKARLSKLVKQAEKAAERYPDNVEVLTWQGIALGGYAREQGKLAALKSAKAARDSLEKAVKLDTDGDHGSAYVTLGLLYSGVPGWPVAFGDDAKAESFFKKGIAARGDADGVDIYVYYAEFLADQKRLDEAKKFARKAVNATPREDREKSDNALQKEAQELLDSLEKGR